LSQDHGRRPNGLIAAAGQIPRGPKDRSHSILNDRAIRGQKCLWATVDMPRPASFRETEHGLDADRDS
jgi:hypothetical protein